MSVRRKGLTWLLGLLLVAGCSTPQSDSGPSSAEVPTPAAIYIPSIGASSTLIPLGLNPDGTLATPPVNHPEQASWYDQGPRPGEIGAAVILGHYDGNGGAPGVFVHLRALLPGSEIFIRTRDGATLRFVVARKQQVDKHAFPTDEVYRNVTAPELRLITCGGAFDATAGSYTSNVIVYAVLAGEA